jgi:YVTN family beta-propeller protein
MRLRVLLVSTILSGLIAGPALAQEKHPVYVGARACAACHDGKGMGHQYSKWLLTHHAHAYASLSMPEAVKMARLSGIPQDPHEAPVCLGCHATAAEAEPWERDEAFRVTDGVQCEKCHGPGSEYMDAKVMSDRDAAMKAGMRMPTKQDCLKCHYIKGSHVAIHNLPQIDADKAWERIAHRKPTDATPDGLIEKAATPLPGPKYAGVQACNKCHDTAMMNRQVSAWHMTAHARAWAVLATPAADEIAAKMGVSAEPQKSAACLKCHTTGYGQEAGRLSGSFTVADGVGCEACHGPGSEYMSEAVMRDRLAAKKAGMTSVTPATCMGCHEHAHGKPFVFSEAVRRIAHPSHPATAADDPRYKTPRNLAVRPDGAEVWVACEAGYSVVVVDLKKRLKVAEIPVGGQPNDVTFSPDGSRAYVSNRVDDTVSVIDVATRKVTSTIAVGDEPHGLLTDKSGQFLYVINTSTDDLSVIDTTTLKEVRRLSTSRYPWSLALSPDGSRLLVTNALSRFVPFRQASVSEITIIDARSGRIEDRLVVPEANLLQGIAWHPSGEFAFFTLNRTKNLVPMTRIAQGWTITNGLGVVWVDGRIDQVLLDDTDRYFADASDVAFTPDGRYALVTSRGTDRVAIVDVDKLIAMLKKASPRERAEMIPNHLALSTEFVVAHVPTKNAPQGVVVTPDGKTALVANALDDSLTAIDLDRPAEAATTRIDLGGPKTVTQVRRGEQLFHSADICFQRQFSCSSCHPDGHVDGLTYDIEADGIGVSPVDNRTLRGILDTDPFKWEGTNPSLARQCGARLAVFFTRIQPFTPDELAALNVYTTTIPRPPNRYRPSGAELTPAQARGRTVFYRTMANDRRVIPVDNRCSTCHFPPYYTDRTKRNVGTQMRLDRQGVFDVPHLNNIYDSAPYLHNGIADTLEEIWTRFNPYDTHGVTNDMTKDQLNDLIEFLKTL